MFAFLFLLLAGCIAPAEAQGLKTRPDYSLNPEWFPRVYKPYVMKRVPEIELENSAILTQLGRDGKLQLSLSQLKTAVSENNLDILSSNNGALYAQTDMLRVKGGGAPRGGAGVQIPSSLFAGAIGAGVGGSGGLGSFGGTGITGGARQVSGFARGSYDPTIAIGFSHGPYQQPTELHCGVRLAGSNDRIYGLPDALLAGVYHWVQHQRGFQQHAPEFNTAIFAIQSKLCFAAFDQPNATAAEWVWPINWPAFPGGGRKRKKDNE